jgi:hypothetical protein
MGKNEIYINTEGNSCSKEDTAVTSFLALHTTHENHRGSCTNTQEETFNHLRKSVSTCTVIIGCVL